MMGSSKTISHTTIESIFSQSLPKKRKLEYRQCINEFSTKMNTLKSQQIPSAMLTKILREMLCLVPYFSRHNEISLDLRH